VRWVDVLGFEAGSARRRTLISDPEIDFDENEMEFRLTYEGPLRSANSAKDAKPFRRDHKHCIRRQFHAQLKRLWAETPCLQRGTSGGPNVLVMEEDSKPATTIEALAKKHAKFGFNFVPLVTSELGLMCALDILYLRPRIAGANEGVIQPNGDIDNRLKTLFDALQPPDANQNYSARTPAEDEKPFFVLLEDDRLITRAAVETDYLLVDVDNPDGDHQNDARLIITVRIKPGELNLWNIQYG
jgi:hypothetical protein